MRSAKRLLIKCIQFLYRNAASEPDLGFDIGDTLDPLFGYMSGTPVDRYLIAEAFKSIDKTELFDKPNSVGIEVGGYEYLNNYFNRVRKTKLTFLENSQLTYRGEHEIIGDLTVPECGVSNHFDIAISTQVLVFVKNDLQTVKNFKRMMKPNAVLIGSEPLVAPLSVYENRRYSPKSLRTLLEQEFEIIEFKVLGNAVSSAALILGVPIESLDKEILTKSRPSHGSCMFYIAKKVT